MPGTIKAVKFSFNFFDIGKDKAPTKFSNLSLPNKLRRFPFLMNFVSLMYYMIFKNLIKYGYPGFLYILGRQFYEIILAFFILKKIFKS